MKLPGFSETSGFLKKGLAFVTAVAKDARIPARDKAVLLALVALVISPIDIIPDFIPILGQLDDLVMLVVILDYVFNRIPEEVLVSHFPWEPTSLLKWRKRMAFLAGFVPSWARAKIWKAAGPEA
jgi:uncharacterized membrane protein YkvA (DUF1232 family)